METHEKEKMDFGTVLAELKKGAKVAREGWNGKDMFVFLVAGSEFEVNRAPLDQFYPVGTKVIYRPHMDIKAVDNSIGVWVPSQTDLLAEDWIVVI